MIYAVNPFGADHESSEHDPSYEKGASARFLGRMARLGLVDPPEPGSLGAEKVRLVVTTQRYFALLDSVPLCHFCFAPWTMYDPEHAAAVVRAATGWDVDLPELLRVGERRVTMMRSFNAREGAGREQDTLPEKCFGPLAGEGPLAGTAVDREEWRRCLDLYYEMWGWDPAGAGL